MSEPHSPWHLPQMVEAEACINGVLVKKGEVEALEYGTKRKQTCFTWTDRGITIRARRQMGQNYSYGAVYLDLGEDTIALGTSYSVGVDPALTPELRNYVYAMFEAINAHYNETIERRHAAAVVAEQAAAEAKNKRVAALGSLLAKA